MRIHTDADLDSIVRATNNIPGVAASISVHGSRSHRHGLEVNLSGSGFRRNSGYAGASPDQGATWDEWGIWLNLLFELDPGARVGGTAERPIYADRRDFHLCTDERYKTLTVADQHRRHRWGYEDDLNGPRHVCACGAKRYPSNAPDPHASLAR